MQKHDTLLIASAVAENRRHLRIIMEGRYNLLEAVSVYLFYVKITPLQMKPAIL